MGIKNKCSSFDLHVAWKKTIIVSTLIFNLVSGKQWLLNCQKHLPRNEKKYIKCIVLFPRNSTNEWRHRGVHSVSAATAAMVEEKARVVLARSERAALSQLLADYRTRRITVEELVASLADLLNTHEKLTLLIELRELVDSKDRMCFDDLVYRPRVSMSRVIYFLSFAFCQLLLLLLFVFHCLHFIIILLSFIILYFIILYFFLSFIFVYYHSYFFLLPLSFIIFYRFCLV